MNMLKTLLTETCPVCKAPLLTSSSNVWFSRIVKVCPNGHCEKEFHPALGNHVDIRKA